MANEKRRKSHRRTLILAAALLISIIIVALGVYQGQQPRILGPADEYFRIFDATVNNGDIRDDGSVLVYDMSFKLQAVKGDAHDIVVTTEMPKAAPENFVLILKGEFVSVLQQSPNRIGYMVRNQSGTLPFPVRIISKEAEGTITIDLSK